MAEESNALKRIKYKIVNGKLQFEEPTFMVNGRKYTWWDSVCFDRLNRYEELSVMVTYGMTVQELVVHLRKAWDANNEQRFGDGCVILNDIMRGVANLTNQKRIHPAFEMCSMFCNYEGENFKVYSSEVVREKYNDFTAEGYDPQDFFSLAIAFIPGFIRAYEQATQDISQQ